MHLCLPRLKPRITNNIIVLPRTLNLEPGDVLVVRSERRVSRDVFLRLQAQFQERFPDNKIVVLEAGLTLDVIKTMED